MNLQTGLDVFAPGFEAGPLGCEATKHGSKKTGLTVAKCFTNGVKCQFC